MTPIEKLERLRNYGTRYEIAAINGVQRIRIAYTSRHSRQGLLAAVRRNGPEVVKLTGSEMITFGQRAADGGISGDWHIGFTGRTQRDAICNGELVLIGAEP